MSKDRLNKICLKKDSRIGIINRGEAAMRFIRALKEYNRIHDTELLSVAFYLDIEKDAYFVQEADLACPLSRVTDAPQTGSMYLNKEVMIKALQDMDCDGVWVGWGFVSEDADFAEMVEKNNLVFLGPDSQAMAALGDKIQAKELAEKADVPILPWSKGPVRSLDEAKKISEEIGYPVIIKASNAGGGRGIRFVYTPDQLESQYESARSETVRITGNDIVFIEYLVTSCRHLEVQTIADRHGNVRTFGVRDCSVQRRNQKIIEETPPPNLDEKIVREMEAASARLIKEAQYESAGTVEYLFDMKTQRFFFMEVNTRLQVEHPITELAYDFDLVQGQIDIAFGRSIGSEQSQRKRCAIELRLNAEDPDRDFTPAPGLVSVFEIPAGPGLRVDSGIRPGNTIPSEFDSMVAKIIAYGQDRKKVFARLSRALKEMKLKIEKGTTNRAFLLELLNKEEIRAGGVNTAYVGELIKDKQSVITRENWPAALIAGAIEQAVQRDKVELLNFKEQLISIGHPRSLPKPAGYDVSIGAMGQKFEFFVRECGANRYQIELDDMRFQAVYEVYEKEARLYLNEQIYHIQMVDRGDSVQCELDGIPYPLEVGDSGFVAAPSPAVVLSIAVEEGQQVNKGEVLLSLEAMKMEMIVDAPQSGIVKQIYIHAGSQVAAGQPLVLLDTEEQEEEEESAEVIEVDFSGLLSADPDTEWSMLLDQLQGVFLGYDMPKSSTGFLDSLIKKASSEERKQELRHVFSRCMEIYLAVEKLFSRNQVYAESFAKDVSFKEMLYHFFRRTTDKTKGLPDDFINAFKRAGALYDVSDLEDVENLNHAVSHLYKSHAQLKEKTELLKSCLLALEELGKPEQVPQELSQLFDELVIEAVSIDPALSDTANYMRYVLIDEVQVKKLRKDQVKELASILDQSLDPGNPNDDLERLTGEIIDSGPEMIAELLKLYCKSNSLKQQVILPLMAKRLNRDRSFIKGDFCTVSERPIYIGEYGDNNNSVSFLLAVACNQQEVAENAAALLKCAAQQKNNSLEIALLCFVDQLDDIEAGNLKLLKEKVDCTFFSIAAYSEQDAVYHSYQCTDKGWEEIEDRRYLSPDLYREFRIHRLENFNLNLLYRSSAVYIYSIVARENPKDERLFAFLSANDSKPELSQNNDIHRLVNFEHVFAEAVSEMRLIQGKRQRRLFWNRIIIHNRAFMRSNLQQIKNYGENIIARVTDLGLEGLNVYTRRKKFNEEKVREVELVFQNISGNQLSLRSRKPNEAPLEPMNRYVSSVVRARQRKTVYPYEIIRMITHSGFPFNFSFPKGEFEEYDIEIDDKGQSRPVSVKGRKYGDQTGNIVFGIISNITEQHPKGLTRVIILSDAAKDMGTLAEPECRRVNAALDLAEELGVPVEWLPISSGARIDMESGTENLDWTAATLKRIIEFTQNGGEINIIVAGINVGAQSYWNAEATMLMHTKGLLIMTDSGAMLLTGKKALDFAGSVSAPDNLGIGGVERIMGPNGQAQIRVANLGEAYQILFKHYAFSYKTKDQKCPAPIKTEDKDNRDVGKYPYNDTLGQGFTCIGDIFSKEKNAERKKPFDMRQVMRAIIDTDTDYLERWKIMKDSETSIVWETRVGGHSVGMIGIESKTVSRLGEIPFDGPEAWNGGTLFPLSSKKVARGINAFSGQMPLVLIANLSGFDGSPESLRNLQLEYGAEIGRAIVNFKGPICFIVVARYHGGAYVVFSKFLNPRLKSAALEGSYASVIGGAPAAAVVFPRKVREETMNDKRIIEAQQKLNSGTDFTKKDYDDLYQKVYTEKQAALGQYFDNVHNVERARKVGSIDDIVTVKGLRPYIIKTISE